MNQVNAVFGLHVLLSLCLILYFLPRLKFDTLTLSLFAFGWLLDSKSGLSLEAYSAQILAAILMLFSIERSKEKGNVIWKAAPPAIKNLFYSALAVAGAQLATALYLGDSFEGVVRFSLLAIGIRYSANFLGERKILAFNLMLSFLVIYCLTVITAGVTGVDVYLSKESGGSRFGGLIGHPNYAAYVAVGASLFLLSRFSQPRIRVLFFFCVLVASLTLSRTALVALALGVLIYLLRRSNRGLGYLLGIGVGGLALFLSSFGQNLIDRFSWISTSGGLTGQNSSGWRLNQWQYAINRMIETNWQPVGWNNSGNYLLSGLPPHNYFIQAAMELGVIGLLTCCWLFFAGVSSIFKSSQLRPLLVLVVLGPFFDAGALVPSFAFTILIVPIFYADTIAEKTRQLEIAKTPLAAISQAR